MEIHELLLLTRPLIIFDFETTGVDVKTARIVELGFKQYTSEGLKRTYRHLINPEIPIPPETTAIHHITDEMVKDQPKFRELASNLAKGFSNCDFAGKNIRYDLQVCSAEMTRSNVSWSYSGARIIDADRLEQLGEPRSLSHLYKKHTGEDLDDAHEAFIDVDAVGVIIVRQLEKYEVLPRDVQRLHDLQWPGWIDSEGKFKFDNSGEPSITFGKHRGQPMRSIPRGYYEWLIRSDFSDEIKKIASDALCGLYPMKS